MDRKAGIFLADGFEEIEALTTINPLRLVGFGGYIGHSRM